SIGMSASASASCHANTCAYTVSMSVPSRSKMSASATRASLQALARDPEERQRIVAVVRTEGPAEANAEGVLQRKSGPAGLFRRLRRRHQRHTASADVCDVALGRGEGREPAHEIALCRLRAGVHLADEDGERPRPGE